MKKYNKPELELMMLSIEEILLESGLEQIDESFGFGSDVADETI